MRASEICCLISCLVFSALAVHHPLHKHRHGKEKRTEVLVVEEDITVEDIDLTIYLPGPPPEAYEHHQEGWRKEHEQKQEAMTTYKLPGGSITIVPAPKPTNWRPGHSGGKGKKFQAAPSHSETTEVKTNAGEGSLSKPATISSTTGDSGSDTASSLLSEAGGSPRSATKSASPSTPIKASDSGKAASLVAKSTGSASAATDPPATTHKAPASSVLTPKSSPASTAATPSHSGAFPFTALVVFGDNLSDNGNGSSAHNVAANSPTDVVPGNKIYGFGTWTNGPVAASYLADLLAVPLSQNLAFGHAWGGSHAGATIDDTMVQSNFSASLASGPWFNKGEFSAPCWGAPSAKVQIDTYIARGVDERALHFLWIGANDMAAAYGGTYGGNLGVDDASLNERFAANISTKIPALVSTLLLAGAPYVLVANLYPKHLAPLWPNYLSITTPSQWDALGAAIATANDALEAALKALPGASRIIYYDAFTFMADLYRKNPGGAFPNMRDTNGWPSFCDGDAEETAYVASINGTVVDGVEVRDNWDYCVTLGHQDEWFWMQYLDPTSHVHRLVAGDMERVVREFAFPSL